MSRNIKSTSTLQLLQMFTEDVFVFSLLVYIAHQSFLDDAVYKFTYLLTASVRDCAVIMCSGGTVIVVQVVHLHVVHLPRLHVDIFDNATPLIEVGA